MDGWSLSQEHNHNNNNNNKVTARTAIRAFIHTVEIRPHAQTNDVLGILHKRNKQQQPFGIDSEQTKRHTMHISMCECEFVCVLNETLALWSVNGCVLAQK